ncbi:MAG: ATP-binding protein [Caldilineaceae bacterium]|nr:ATP-binding protein [Caldilineaceae bacterium]
MRRLPISIQDFAELRQEGYLYVDKTEQIHALLQTGKLLFLARPRRFGKSLLITTLREIFRGNQELFQGLWIEDKLSWEAYPVLLLNFNDIDYREQTLAAALDQYVDRLAAQAAVRLTSGDYKSKFLELIVQLSETQKVVLLVDEYDKPITDLLENDAKVEEHIGTLKNLYSVLKSTQADHIHFALFTGVSKYGKLSVFSDLNNLLDITLDRRFATLLGYTEPELATYFGEYLARLALTQGIEQAELLERVRFWYDGYSWDGTNRLYVPYSTLILFEQQTFGNHWFATATPSFLLKLLRLQKLPAYELEAIDADTTFMDSADVDQISIQTLLFQTGYLTVKRLHFSAFGEPIYTLGYPNYEVQQAFQRHLLADYLNVSTGRISASILNRLQKALHAQDVEAFINILKSVFAAIPNTLFLAKEAYYHSVFYLLLNLLGFTIDVEQLTNRGRIDAVLELQNIIYIIEFKLSTAKIALEQIRNRGYAVAYQNRGKPILLLGIAFDTEQRNLADWQSEQV